MKIKTSTLVLGTGVVVGLVVLWLAKDTKTQPSPDKKAGDQKQPPPGMDPATAELLRRLNATPAPAAGPYYGSLASTLYPKA